MRKQHLLKYASQLALILISTAIYADQLNCGSTSDKALSLGCIAVRLTGGATSVVDLLLGLSFVSGWGFIIAAIFKFKQVRENPTQVPVSTPFAFLLTAMLLIFIPGLMTTGGVTIFGNMFSGSAMSLTGEQAKSIGLVSSTYTPQLTEPSSDGLFGTAARLTEIFPDLMNVIVGSAYLAGLGFSIAAMIKLKAVRDNPQQNPVTMPLAYIMIAVLLVFMPSLITPVSETLFGDSEDVQAGALGQGSSALIQQ